MSMSINAASGTEYIGQYKSALSARTGSDVGDSGHTFTNLIELFTDLKHPDTRARVEKIYSRELYFNDTIHSFENRDELADYIVDSADKLDKITVVFEDTSRSGNNFYVRWSMYMDFRVMGKAVHSQSIGVSMIRFDEHGKIVFHQDFWDNTTGLFSHIPVIGGALNRIKAGM